MTYTQQILNNQDNPGQLEALYRQAVQQKQSAQFAAELEACLAENPGNLLYQAWHHRLASAEAEASRSGGAIANWKLALPLALANGLVFWLLSDPRLSIVNDAPTLLFLAGPVTALFVIWFVYFSAPRDIRVAALRRTAAASIGLALVAVTALLLQRFVAIRSGEDYLILLVPHLALSAWLAAGVALLGRKPGAGESFAYLMKSLEVLLVGGVYLIAGMALGGVTLGMFSALSVEIPEALMRLIAAGGAGLIPLIAVATVYNPLAAPAGQDFSGGLSKFSATIMRLLLPLALGVLVVYIVFIPFNFLQPFQNRDVLIIYNIMLFGIMGLIAGATPIDLAELSPRLAAALKKGILAVAGLGTLVSLYALSAILYRTLTAALTINRTSMIGWNGINITLLVLMLTRLLRKTEQPWNERIQGVYRLGAAAYILWTLFVVLVAPVIFR